MALSKVQEIAEGYLGDVGTSLVWKVFELTGPASYTTGGESLTAADMKISRVLLVLPGAARAQALEYDYVNSKLKFGFAVASHSHTENTAGAYAQNATTAGASARDATAFPEMGGTAVANTFTQRIFVIGLA